MRYRCRHYILCERSELNEGHLASILFGVKMRMCCILVAGTAQKTSEQSPNTVFNDNRQQCTFISRFALSTELGLVSVTAEEAALDSTLKRSLCSCFPGAAPLKGSRTGGKELLYMSDALILHMHTSCRKNPDPCSLPLRRVPCH